MTTTNEIQMIKSCQKGELEAFEGIFQLYRRPLFSVAYRLLSSHDEAEDVLQDTFLKLFSRIGQYQFQSAFSTWLHRIIVNSCYDRLKVRKRAAFIDLDVVEEPSENSQHELRFHLQRAIDDLPPRMKMCFVLYAQEGYKQREIAELLSMKEGTVKAQVFEAKTKLRNTMTGRLQKWEKNEL